MTNKKLNSMISGGCVVVFLAYAASFLVGIVLLLIKMFSTDGLSDLLKLEVTISNSNSVSEHLSVFTIVFWILLYLLLMCALAICALAVIGLIKSSSCLYIYVLLLAMLDLVSIILMSGMNFGTGTITLGINPLVTIAPALGWMVLINFFVSLIVIGALLKFIKIRER